MIGYGNSKTLADCYRETENGKHMSDVSNNMSEMLMVWENEKLAVPFSGRAIVEYCRPTGGGDDPDSFRGFGATGHLYKVTEGNRVEYFDI